MKKCRKCDALKPLEDFYRMAGMRDGHRNECKACSLAEKAERNRRNPEANRRRAREWAKANPERVAAQAEAYRASGRKKTSDRKSYLKRKYGITIEKYEAMLALQGGGCAICGRRPRPDIALHVDHDHETGEIRGLLCFPCNNFLGDIEDDLQRLRAAAEYLEHGMEEPELEWAIRERVEELKLMGAARG